MKPCPCLLYGQSGQITPDKDGRHHLRWCPALIDGNVCA